MSNTDRPQSLMERRLKRLEALFSVILLEQSSGFDRDAYYLLEHFLRDRENSGRESDRLLEEVLYRISSGGRFPDREIARQVSSIEERIESIAENMKRLGVSVQENELKLAVVDRSLTELSQETHQWLTYSTLGIDQSETKIHRFLPLNVYISEGNQKTINSVSAAFTNFVEAFGLFPADEFPEVRGSWYKKWFAKSKELLSSPEVQERLEKIERSLELKHMGEPQATIDEKQAGAVAALLKSIEPIPMVAMQVGSILLLKIPSDNGPMVQVKTLSQKEILILENDQSLLASPTSLLSCLAQRCATTNIDWLTRSLTSSSKFVSAEHDKPVFQIPERKDK